MKKHSNKRSSTKAPRPATAKAKPHDGAITIALDWLTKEYGDQMLSTYQDILVQLLDDDWALENLSQDLFEALQSNLTE